MTIIEAITRADSLKPNTYTPCDKIKWLSTLDGIIKENIIETHEGCEVENIYAGDTAPTETKDLMYWIDTFEEPYVLKQYIKENDTWEFVATKYIRITAPGVGAALIKFLGYNDDTDVDTVLLVPAPFDNIYISWLESRIDYANGEINRYQNSSLMYNTDYINYANYYNRNNMPIGNKRKYF